MTGEPSAAHAVLLTTAKQRLRTELAARRAGSGNTEGDRTARALELCAGSEIVACYASRPGEPDTWELIDALTAAGTRVLLPVLTREPDWAWYTGRADLRESRRGILEPTGVALGSGVLVRAEWVFVPGLAATRRGERLGTGGGWYDRALLKTAPAARTAILLYDGEVVDDLPVEPWDRRVQFILTASQVQRAE
ncbi:MAG: 5-formyltetrahydrofolate cyclo-ligase [Propionicimonas sp.]|nr:5-formyltetrahydrofolate cyclo-ligase [Propionicimonas sp.]